MIDRRTLAAAAATMAGAQASAEAMVEHRAAVGGLGPNRSRAGYDQGGRI